MRMQTWPSLREELALLPGPVLADGQPSHTLHDPVRNQFFQLDWPTFEVLRRWHMGSAAGIARDITRHTTLQLAVQDVLQVLDFFKRNQLLQVPPGEAASLAQARQQGQGSVFKQLLHHYLFFRIPLVRPDAWLSAWAPRLAWLFTTWFACLTCAALGWGLLEVYRQWSSFTTTLVDTLSWSGLLSYGVAITIVKVLHELGHAFTAKRLGCKVPTMGVAFLVLWPVAYTDTNEVWKLTQRRQRVAVCAAGVLTEMAVAAWATLAWALLPAGTPKALAFVLATTSLASTLLINTSPFMRFDGYFLLSDWLSMPNLHDRAFALARWRLREWLFKLGATPPEYLPTRRRMGLICFAFATWAYRLGVFLGIAVLVYAFFIKAVGIMLFAVEIGWFVLKPLWQELRVWRMAWPGLRQHKRTWFSMSLLGAAFALLFAPWPTRPSGSALLRPAEQLVIYAPPHAQLLDMPVREGQHVPAGTLLMRMGSPELANRLRAADARAEQLAWQSSASGFDNEQRARWQVLQAQASAAQADQAAVQADAQRYAPKAPFAGVLRDVPPELQPGEWLGHDEPVARLVADQGQTVMAYFDEDDLARIQAGDVAHFYADDPAGPVVRLSLASIEPDARRTLNEPELVHLFGGGVLVREKNNQFYPERPVYLVSFKVLQDEPAASQHTWRGKVVVQGAWSAPGWRYLRHAAAVIRREAGF